MVSLVFAPTATVLSALHTLLPDGGVCATDQFAFAGLLTGHVLALALGWRCGVERGTDGPETGSRTLSKNVTFSVLKNRRRRRALRYLRRVGGKSCLRDLAEHVAARENDVETDELTSAQRKRVYITLYQYHLPKMDDAGIVEYDQDRGDVELLDAASELFEYIDDASGRARH